MKQKIQITPNEKKNYKFLNLGTRHLQFFLLFLTLLVLFAQRASLTIAIVAMTDKHSPNGNVPTYPNWTNTDTILSAFFWGNILPQIVAGELINRFGAKYFLLGALIASSIFNFLVPLMAAKFGAMGVIIIQVLEGIAQGFTYPCSHNLISQWSPLFERTTVSTLVYGGLPLGLVVITILCGVIAGSQLGWPWIFYFFGGFGPIWVLISGWFLSSSPSTHQGISEDEKIYIESGNFVTNDPNSKNSTPWKSMLSSVPFWSIVVTVVGANWCHFTLTIEMPSFMDKILHLDIKTNSQLSSIPYFVMFVINLAIGPISDKLISKNILSVITTRKILNTIGSVGPGLALFALGFVNGTQKTLAAILLVLAVGSSAACFAGGYVNLFDIAPNHAATLVGIIHSLSTLCSILAPLVVGFFGDDKSELILWRKVFWLSAAISIITGLIYAFFAKGEVQSWNMEEKEDHKNEV